MLTRPEYSEFTALSPVFVPLLVPENVPLCVASVPSPVMSVDGIVDTNEKLSVAVSFTYPAPVSPERDVSPASTGCLVVSATVIFAVPSKATPFIFLGVVSLGAEFIVITGVVVGLATVASLVDEETLTTDHPPLPTGNMIRELRTDQVAGAVTNVIVVPERV